MINMHSIEDEGLLTSFSQRHKVLAVALATVFVGSGKATTRAFANIDESEPLTTFSNAYKEYSNAIKANKSPPEEIVKLAQLTFQLGKAKFGPRHQHTYLLQKNLANAYLSAGDYTLSAEHYEAIIDYYEETQGDESQSYYFALLNIINLLHTSYKAKQLTAQDLGIPQYGRDKAINKLIHVTEELVHQMPENSIMFRGHTVKTAVTNRWAAKNNLLLNMAKKFSTDVKKNLGETSAVYVESMVYLGQICFEMQKNKDALNLFESVLASPQAKNPDMQRFILVTHAHLVSLFARKNQLDEAVYHSQIIGKLRTWDGEKAPLHRVMPKFPSSRVANTDTDKASVTLGFDINEHGQPVNIKAVRSTHAAFNKFAKTALQQWFFTPKCVDGEFTIARDFDLTIDFIRE